MLNDRFLSASLNIPAPIWPSLYAAGIPGSHNPWTQCTFICPCKQWQNDAQDSVFAAPTNGFSTPPYPPLYHLPYPPYQPIQRCQVLPFLYRIFVHPQTPTSLPHQMQTLGFPMVQSKQLFPTNHQRPRGLHQNRKAKLWNPRTMIFSGRMGMSCGDSDLKNGTASQAAHTGCGTTLVAGRMDHGLHVQPSSQSDTAWAFSSATAPRQVGRRRPKMESGSN